MASFLTRRRFLSHSTLIGCSLAASPLVTPMSFAATPGKNRLVVIILRGGMDGLDVLRPYGDPAYAALRGNAGLDAPNAAVDLDGYFALHPALRPLMPLWRDGQLAFAHAVSTPYRDKRSHFDGQDMLEAGLQTLSGGTARDGWLNRVIQHLPGATGQTAYAIGRAQAGVLNGPAEVQRWSPDSDLILSPQAVRLARLVMRDDPLFGNALSQALALAESGSGTTSGDVNSASGTNTETQIAEFTGARLREETRIASFSINGWDTHQAQDRGLPRALSRLSDAILTLRDSAGAQVWDKTTVVAVTEFGRTAHINGSGGTDHGTGGVMVTAGGALRGGRVVGDWPGLSEAQLYDRRDLMPTRDLRSLLGWILHSQFGLQKSMLETSVFPDMDLGDDPRLVL
ncbi:MAG: DUF1501 domain-containing protein [Sulfitobacter sp.]